MLTLKSPTVKKKCSSSLKNAKATPTQTITQTQNSLTCRLVDLLTLDFRRTLITFNQNLNEIHCFLYRIYILSVDRR